ncbi:MAG: type II secretion system protein [Candidatus Gottesmanbacteria bacterium]
MRKITLRKGFTLVELLIVIALLGALAIGLIGALDPFEQLKKGTDTGTRDLVNQVQTAVLRYYATTNKMPWPEADEFESTDLETGPLPTAIINMITAGEMKSNFNEIYSGQLNKVWVSYVKMSDTSSVQVRVCYAPGSKSFQVDPATKYLKTGLENTGTETAACKSVTGGAALCYWCVQ